MTIAARTSIVLAACLAIAACDSSTKQAAQPQPSGTTPIAVVELPHGTIAAVPGSPEDQLARFLASNDPAPRTFRFGNDEFAPWSDQISPRTQARLSTIILILRDYPTANVSLVGYTDNDGPEAENQALSERRVDTLERLLVSGGIAKSRITTQGKGMADPIAPNDSEADRTRNRRIEITVTSK